MHRACVLLARVGLTALVAATMMMVMGGARAEAASPCGHVRRAPRWHHIVVISFENHSYQQVLGKTAPRSYFKTLASKCGSAHDFTAAHFPRSLGNYLAATGGRVVTPDDCIPSRECSSGGPNIFRQIGRLHWRLFAESMPKPCDPNDTRLYVPRHAPAIYYRRIPRRVCHHDMVTMPSHPLKLKRRFTWIAPNLQHDMHDGTLSQASQWLQRFLGGPHGVLHRRPYTRGHTAIFIWFDSPGHGGSVRTPIPFIVISPSTPHKLALKPLNQYSALRGWEGMLGLPCIANACDANGTRRAFHL